MKKILAVLLTVCMLLPMFALLPAFAATPAEGFDFTDGDKWYYMDGTLPDAPRTVEAWIWVDPANATQTRTIISNYNGFGSVPYWHLAVKYDGGVLYPYFEWNELSNNSTSVRKFNFRNTEIVPGEWTHITVVIDAENNCCHCYKDGAYVQSNNAGIWLGDITRNVTELPLVIGNDCRANLPDARVFGGKIASVSIFNDVRTAAEIQSDFTNGADYRDANAIAHWELPASGGAVVDKSGKSAGLTLSKYWLTEAEMQAIRGNDFNPAYSFAIVGDIQYMVRNDASRGTNYTETVHNWIKNNVATKNIQYVMGMGDVTNHCVKPEWDAAYNAIKILNGVVPYSIINGNHDWYISKINPTEKDANGNEVPIKETDVRYPLIGEIGMGPTAIDKYFGADEAYMNQFTGENGGLYEEGSVRNTYTKFTVGSTKWLFINLDYSPTDDILAWANRVVADHPDHKVVMTTHGYMHMDGTPLSHEDSGSLNNNSGEEMWTKFVSLHENIVMVLSGHMECNLLQMKQAKGVHGNTVTQFLVDQQTVDYALMDAGKLPLGLVAMFYFDEDGENVSVEWYSTTYDKYFQTRNQFSFNMNADCEEQIFPWDGLSIAPKGSGTESDPYIVENGGNLLWMANRITEAGIINVTEGGTLLFEDTYFKQICDIDLDGLCIKSIGYYHTSESGIEKAAAFAGHYDGGGYSIKNGRVINAIKGQGVNINHTAALFGCIWGATIENVTLDNVTVWSRTVSGGIVGRAVAPRNANAPADFNVISNCHMTDSCRIVAVWANDKSISATEYGYNTRYRAGVVGSICGISYATTIKGCSSAVEIKVDGEHSMVGGIAGMAGYNSVIENCAFTGGITLTDMNTTVSPTFGGIVALLAPNYETETMNTGDDYRGTLTVRNCYNSGYFTYTGTDALPAGLEMHWGGILGHAKMLEHFSAGRPYLIENCYNLYAKTIESALAGNANYFVGGIVGKADAGNYNAYDSLTVRNCASVTVAANGGDASASTNEYRTTGIRSMYNKLPVLATNVTTTTATEINGKLEALRLEWLIEQNAQNGTKWYYGEGAPAINANVGDMYLDMATGDVYQLALEWALIGNIRGPQGEQGIQGEKGDKGETGATGPQGPQGEQGETGAQGPQGEKGEQGEPGVAGNKWYVGETDPATVAGAIAGDLYMNTKSCDVFRFDGSVWSKIGNIKGAQGAQGLQGEAGKAPVITIVDGYWYIDGETTNVKAEGKDGDAGTMGSVVTIGENGNWHINGEDTEIPAQGPKGDAGDSGNKWYTGETDTPNVVAPNAGDMYMNTTNGNVYQYNGTAWVAAGNLTGPQGPQGDKGDTGATGPQGPQGEQGETGATGPQGPQGDKGDTGATGPQGPQGEQGETGATGPQGPQGDKGDTGATGPAGPQGEKGDKGDTGASADSADQSNSGSNATGGDTVAQNDGGSNAVGVVALIIAIVLLVGNGVFAVFYFLGKKKKA